MARRYYGCVKESLAEYSSGEDNPGAKIALEIVSRISPHKVRDWQGNSDAINKMRGEIDDILFEITEERNLSLSVETFDAIIDQCIEIAIANEG